MTPPTTSDSSLERLWRTALTPRWLAALLALIVLVAAFIVLGQWQWDRTQDILAAERSAAAAPIDLADLVDDQGSWNNADIGRTVNLQGTFTDDELLLANRELDGQAGVWVVTRFELDGGQTVAVVRGWLPNDASPSPLSRQSVIIQGVLHPDEEFYEGANATRVVTVEVPPTVQVGDVAFPLQNFFYAIQWWVFALFAVVVYARWLYLDAKK
ncbi:MAG: SURF1 family protein [Actinobacteria bacterium]|nr:SURF1 family protein [Actinomycetota bacterium]